MFQGVLSLYPDAVCRKICSLSRTHIKRNAKFSEIKKKVALKSRDSNIHNVFLPLVAIVDHYYCGFRLGEASEKQRRLMRLSLLLFMLSLTFLSDIVTVNASDVKMIIVGVDLVLTY